MLRIQYKIFFRSGLRIAILVFLFLGSLYYYYPAISTLLSGEVYYDSFGILYKQLLGYLYFFIPFLLLAYDFFSEIPHANLLEILKSNKNQLKHDITQGLVLLSVVLLYAFIFVVIHMMCHQSEGIANGQIFFYYIRVVGIFYVLNGMVAILLSWLISRTTGKVLGYVCIILFAFAVSPILVDKLKFYVLWARGIFDLFKVFFLAPEGVQAFNEYSAYAANLSIASRGIFWIGLLVVLLSLYYFKKKKLFQRSAILVSGLACCIWAGIYCNLPTSYYCFTDSLDARDTETYDQFLYIIDNAAEQKKKEGFKVCSYDMDFKLRRNMKAKVELVPEDKKLETYDMTLYHLYEIDNITDEAGEKLEYIREGDYLTVYNQEDGIEAINVNYHGGSSAFFSDYYAAHLNGAFPYYPIPGWKEIYKDYEYIDNRLEEEAWFDVRVNTGGTVYSDLDRVGENEFSGYSDGPTLVSGFLKEEVLDCGVRYIYSYVFADYVPGTELTMEDQAFVEEVIKNEYKDLKVLIYLPYPSIKIEEEDKILGSTIFWVLRSNYEKHGSFSRYIEPMTAEEAADIFQSLYWDMKEHTDQEIFYDNILIMYGGTMGQYGYTDDQFEEFIKSELGEEEWNYMMEGITNGEN